MPQGVLGGSYKNPIVGLKKLHMQVPHPGTTGATSPLGQRFFSGKFPTTGIDISPGGRGTLGID